MNPSSSRFFSIPPRGLLLAWSCLGLALPAAAATPKPVDFDRDIRPILSDKCFHCHGPDDKTRKAHRRLDTFEGATALHDGLRAVDPSSPAKSELLRRILAKDPDDVMPPPDAPKHLRPSEIERLRNWVLAGAPYARHWAFIPPAMPPIPHVARRDWVRNPIDAFVLARLGKEGLPPSPPASKETLIRRVTFDLTGLPPTPEEVSDFVQDSDPLAYEKRVDRLLSSPRYGERMALAWMDAARYGDTSVMHADGPRDMWPWRDWTIRAYNANKPFDQFLIEQLAGDLLPHPTRAQQVATGFNRNHASSDEGGAIPEELRVRYVVDCVKTTFNVFQALTMECGQCHSHKYDPFSQKEYYGLFAFFNNTLEPGMQTRGGNQTPVVALPNPATDLKITAIDRRLEAQRKRFQAMKPAEKDVLAWIEKARAQLGRVPTVGDWYVIGPFSGGTGAEAFGRNFIKIRPEGPDLSWKKDGFLWLKQPGWTDGDDHPLRMHESSSAYLYRKIRANSPSQLALNLAGADAFKVWLNGRRIFSQYKSNWDGKHKDDKDKPPFEPSVKLDLKPGDNHLVVKVLCGSDRSLDLRFSFSNATLAAGTDRILRAAKLSPKDREALERRYRQVAWKQAKSFRTERHRLLAERRKWIRKATSSMVMRDRKIRRPTYLLKRGRYDAPVRKEEILPGVPKVFPPLPEGAPLNRLGLALWMTRPDHPLTARVAVNRYWAMLFGRGLVRTVMDFGNQGAHPTHPALLDWLAVDFRRNGWDVKRTIRQILTSSTYRQSSRVTPELAARDPDNELLARGPRFRLQGEFIRDNAMAVSGLLVGTLGGPGVKPYQPPGLWNEVSLDKNLKFVQDHRSKLYRRSMYIYWKRSAPPPTMTLFDAPTREKCLVQRPRTNTPLQALVTLNDVQFVEASRHLADRMFHEGGSDFESRIDYGFRLCTARGAQPEEIDVCREVYQRQLASFRADPRRAEKYLAQGESKRSQDIDPVKEAAWTAVANLLLNLDEVLTRG